MAEAIAVGSSTQETFTVQGMTGVDLSLPIAGPGSRAFAFLIDWHIRLLIALAWLFGGMLLAGSTLRVLRMEGGVVFWVVIVPSILIYLLYHPLLELLMHGQTPGKRMAGVRVVNREGGPPGTGAILIRNAFRLIDSMPAFYGVGLVTTFFTAQRVRIGDMAAGTLLIENKASTAKAMARLASLSTTAGVDPAALDLVDQLLERWNQLTVDRRAAIARSLLERIDPAQPASGMPDNELRQRLVALSAARP